MGKTVKNYLKLRKVKSKCQKKIIKNVNKLKKKIKFHCFYAYHNKILYLMLKKRRLKRSEKKNLHICYQNPCFIHNGLCLNDSSYFCCYKYILN